MKCPYCGKDVNTDDIDNIVDYVKFYRECKCGTVVNEQGKDVTEDYYN